MSYEEKDYFMRQIKRLAEGLGMMLTLDSVKEIVNFEQSESSRLSDEEIEAILLTVNVQNEMDKRGMTLNQLSEETKIAPDRLTHLFENTTLPLELEIKELKRFLY